MSTYTCFTFPINQEQICGYVALNGKPLNIQDCYEIPESAPYKFNKNTDITTDYRTKSMYTLPLKMANGKLLSSPTQPVFKINMEHATNNAVNKNVFFIGINLQHPESAYPYPDYEDAC